MRKYIYITLLSLTSAIALATCLISSNHRIAPHAEILDSSFSTQIYVDVFQVEDNGNGNQDFILTSNRSSISAQRTAAQRQASRRNSISKTSNSTALKGSKSLLDCRTVSAYCKTKLFPLAAKSGEMLIVRLHEFLI